MTPLQKLDQIMLWIARGVAILFAIAYAALVMALIVFAHKKPDVAPAITIVTALEIVHVGWAIALCRLNNSQARAYLQITVLVYLTVWLFGYAGLLGNILRPDLGLFRLILAGSIAIFWSATRSQPRSNPVLPPIPHASL